MNWDAANPSCLEDLPQAVETTAASEESQALPAAERMNNHAAWERLIDQKLIEWGSAPSDMEEDNLIPPTRAAIQRAIDIVRIMQGKNSSPPMRVVPDGDGGIVFERWNGAMSCSFEFLKNGSVEFVTCQNGRVTQRMVIRP